MKQAFRTITAFLFTLLFLWNVSGLPVMLLHKSHAAPATASVKSAGGGSAKIVKAGAAGDTCQCALHIDLNHFSLPQGCPEVSVQVSEPVYKVPTDPVLRDSQTLITLFGSRAPPASGFNS